MAGMELNGPFLVIQIPFNFLRSCPPLLDCQATFGEQNPSETRNTNLISLDVAPKLQITNRFPNFVYESGVTKFTRKLHQIPSKKSRNFQENSCFYQSRYRSTKIQKILFSRIQPYETLDYESFSKFRLRKWRVRNWLSTPVPSRSVVTVLPYWKTTGPCVKSAIYT